MLRGNEMFCLLVFFEEVGELGDKEKRKSKAQELGQF